MAIDIPTGIDESMTKFGSNEAQRQDAVIVLAPLCDMIGDVVTLKATHAALEDPKSQAWLREHKPHLLPRPYERSTADRAFIDGNLTARGQLVREIGMDEADKLAQSYGLKSASDPRRGKRPDGASDGEGGSKPNGKDRRNNPWSSDGWSITAQGRLVRSIGTEKAAQIAASVGCTLGSTHPNPNY